MIPSYDYSFNAATKNALDCRNRGWACEPLGFVSLGGVAAGARAVRMLKQVMSTLKMKSVFEAGTIPFVSQFLAPDGQPHAKDVTSQAAREMLDEPARWEEPRRPLRRAAASAA